MKKTIQIYNQIATQSSFILRGTKNKVRNIKGLEYNFQYKDGEIIDTFGTVSFEFEYDGYFENYLIQTLDMSLENKKDPKETILTFGIYNEILDSITVSEVSKAYLFFGYIKKVENIGVNNFRIEIERISKLFVQDAGNLLKRKRISNQQQFMSYEYLLFEENEITKLEEFVNVRFYNINNKKFFILERKKGFMEILTVTFDNTYNVFTGFHKIYGSDIKQEDLDKISKFGNYSMGTDVFVHYNFITKKNYIFSDDVTSIDEREMETHFGKNKIGENIAIIVFYEGLSESEVKENIQVMEWQR